MTKEQQINLNVIENEPSILEQYIIELLMTNITNQQYIKELKVHMVILSHT